MKQIPALLLALLCLLACSKTDPSPADLLVGTWQLTTYCKPEPTGCTITPIPASKGVFVTFAADGTYTEVYGNRIYEGYSFNGCPGSYRFEGSTDIRLFSYCSSSSRGRLMKLVTISNRQLQIGANQTGNYVFVRL